MKAARLALSFDADALARDVRTLGESAWTTHFNAGYHDGGWSGVAFRSQGGDASRLYPDPNANEDYLDTSVRSACPSIDAALATFGPALRSARLLKLAAGSGIREHRDYGLSLESGEARLHVPITTGSDVEFYLDGELIQMEPGECWYLDLDLPHRVENFSVRDRVHLVVDCVADDHLRALFPGAEELVVQRRMLEARAARVDTAQQRLDRFRRAALDDPELVCLLAEEQDRERFAELAVIAGRGRELAFSVGDVLATLDAERQAWIRRWIVR